MDGFGVVDDNDLMEEEEGVVVVAYLLLKLFVVGYAYWWRVDDVNVVEVAVGMWHRSVGLTVLLMAGLLGVLGHCWRLVDLLVEF